MSSHEPRLQSVRDGNLAPACACPRDLSESFKCVVGIQAEFWGTLISTSLRKSDTGEYGSRACLRTGCAGGGAVSGVEDEQVGGRKLRPGGTELAGDPGGAMRALRRWRMSYRLGLAHGGRVHRSSMFLASLDVERPQCRPGRSLGRTVRIMGATPDEAINVFALAGARLYDEIAREDPPPWKKHFAAVAQDWAAYRPEKYSSLL